MIEDVLVVDATVHGFNFLPTNYRADFLPDLVQMLYQGAHVGLHPKGGIDWNMTWDEFVGSFSAQPDLLERTVFGESRTDVAVYHGVPLHGVYADGSSPLWVAERVRERFPHRVHIYGPLYTWQPDALEEVDRLVDEVGVVGLKFYPVDLVDGQLRRSRMDDPAMFAIVERARARGLRMIAVHKAVPLGPLPMLPYNAVDDIGPVAEAFPDMVFEIVHGGNAFLAETVALLQRHPNVVVNLESLPAYAPNVPAKWSEIMTAYLGAGLEDRLFWATGAVGLHPEPFLRHFWASEMPGLTRAVKEKILSGNIARYLGWDLDRVRADVSGDEYARLTRSGSALLPPWSTLRPGVPAEVGP